MFPCEFWKIFKNTFFIEYLRWCANAQLQITSYINTRANESKASIFIYQLLLFKTYERNNF